MNPDLKLVMQGIGFYGGAICFSACVLFIIGNIVVSRRWPDDDTARHRLACFFALGFLLVTVAALFSGFRPW